MAWVEKQGVTGRMLYALGLTDILHSWLFWGVYSLLLVNLSVCMTRRFSYVAGLCRFPEQPPEPGANWLLLQIDAVGVTSEQVAAKLRKEGYRTLVSAEDVYGLRGRFASIGHWVFHAGLLAMLLVGGSLAAARIPFGGSVGVGEGEPFDLHKARLISANQELDPDLPPLRFRVESVDVLLESRGIERFDITLSTPENTSAIVGINRPYRSAPYQVLAHGFGFMPGWVIVNSRGRALNSAWLKLLPYPLQEQDSFSLGPEESSVDVRFYPDHQLENEQDRTRSPELRNPRFRTKVIWRGVEVHNGLLAPGERVQLEGGKEFFFLEEIRKYGLLDVIEERAQGRVFACFAVMIVGLLIRYGRIRKEVVVRVGDDSLQFYGQGEIFEHLFAEDLDRLAGEISKTNPTSGDRGDST